MVQHVYELAKRSALLDEVIVATDDQRVYDVVKSFSGNVMLTSVEHNTGSDRIAEIARKIECDFVVNIQGDEPLLIPEIIDEVINALVTDKKQVMATCCYPITSDERLQNPNVVKVVSDINGHAMLFSRAPIPFPRNMEFYTPYEHIGIFAFRKDFLLKYIGLPNTPLSLTESLEQLKAMENGYPIKVVKTKYAYMPPSVKTLADLEIVRKIIASRILM
jgi:3-deoxy-manno-octulosonate cytidylyltransferase (CMP-KDO synthetase)